MTSTRTWAKAKTDSEDGQQLPTITTFQRRSQAIHHVWGFELLYAPVDAGQVPRHVGTLEPLWNLFDLTPEGRPTDGHEQHSYEDAL